MKDFFSKLILKIIKYTIFIAIWLGVACFVIVLIYMHDLPNLSQINSKNNQNIVEVRYSNNNLIATYGKENIDEVDFKDLPQNLINAVISIEDRRFYEHYGIDLLSILRAAYINQKKGYIAQGASTITQQLAKMLFLDSNKTFKRKVQEILLAIQIEKKFTKNQILTMYLNKAYFGSGNYGIKNAARSYFQKNISEINLNESAILASILKAPSKLSPKINKSLVEDRANLVLKNMIEYGYLDESHIAQIAENPDYRNDSGQRYYFSDLIYKNYQDFISYDETAGKISITTTLDEQIQAITSDVLTNFINSYKSKLGSSQIAALIMDYKGRVVAIIGGKDYQSSQFNRAFFAKRQAGSLFKTFIYLCAFENNYNIDDIYIDKKIQLSNWLPSNYNNKYYGKVDLKFAFAKSLNSVSIQLARELTLNKINLLLNKFGIKTNNNEDLTIALGSTSVTLYDIVGSYSIIANKGYYNMPSYIDEISLDKNILYKKFGSTIGPIISQQSAQNIDILLKNAVENGTGIKAFLANNNIRGKTGTSQDYRDAWFVGYSNKYIVGVWIGNDNYMPTNKIFGGNLPAILFADIIDKIDN
jgi:penicillin-binding protein 1A